MPKLISYPLRILDGLVDRVLSLLGAITLAQFPQFIGQYLQRLGGHLGEIRHTVRQFEAMAATLNMTLEEYIKVHLFSGTEVFLSSGEVIQDLIHRLQILENSYILLRQATPVNRWLVFLKVFDPEIFTQTYKIFTPGIPTTIEGGIYALVGLFLAWGVYQGIKNLIRLIFTKERKRRIFEKETGLPLGY